MKEKETNRYLSVAADKDSGKECEDGGDNRLSTNLFRDGLLLHIFRNLGTFVRRAMMKITPRSDSRAFKLRQRYDKTCMFGRNDAPVSPRIITLAD